MQQHGIKCFARTPLSSILGPELGHVVYQIKGNQKCSNMIANILPASPPRPWRWNKEGQNSAFLQHGPVAYQIKWNYECSNTVANNLPSPTPGVKRSKFNSFRKWS